MTRDWRRIRKAALLVLVVAVLVIGALFARASAGFTCDPPGSGPAPTGLCPGAYHVILAFFGSLAVAVVAGAVGVFAHVNVED